MIRLIRKLRANNTGSVVVEFALVLPLMLIFFLGTFETSELIRANMKFNSAVQTLADLVALQNPSSTGTLTADFCTGVEYMMAPFPSGTWAAQVNSVTYNGQSTGIDWTASCGSVSGAKGAVGLSNGMVPNAGDSVIIVQASYKYTSPLAFVLSSSYSFSNSAFARPRNGGTVQFAP
jgi:Flp pilus assembly protein TadG